MKIIDFRSDTVTRPTLEMRRAMAEAEVGDDVYGDDPTVNYLETMAADLLGKEAAVFVASGTMGNQASIMAQTRPGDELMAGVNSHIFQNEAGGAARLSGVSCALTGGSYVLAEDIRRLVRPVGNVHYPRTSLVCLENALGDGRVVSLEQMRDTYGAAKEYGLRVHLDGARFFNAVQALGCEVRELAACADSLSFCLSKGLCAPVGSVVCGEAAFVAEVRRCRKVLGGGLRQAGVLAACGVVALTKMRARLADDHENAKHLGRLLAELPGILVDLADIQINMVFWRPEGQELNDRALLAFMAERGIKMNGPSGGQYRLITHNDITRADVDFFVEQFKQFRLQG